jgi:integrase
MTTEAYLRQWLAHMKGRVRAVTYDGYEALVRVHAIPGLGSIPLTSLHPLQIQDLYAELVSSGRISAKTVGNLHRVLRQSLSHAQNWRLTEWNPAAAAQPPRAKRTEPRIVDLELAERILAVSIGTRWEAPVAIAIATGMRRGEILALRWSDLDEDYTTARVKRTLEVACGQGLVFEDPKTPKSRRAVALPAFLVPHLQRHRVAQAARRKAAGARWREQGLVVDRGDGTPWNPDRFSSAWPWFLHASKLPHVRFHDLRHGHATLMLMQGVHPKIVSERLGHSSIGITLDTYSHVLPSMQGEAVKAFDLLFERP